MKRGELAWQYLYITFGFALTIEAGLVALIEPLPWLAKVLAFAIMAGGTLFLWLDGWFQNKLFGWKARYEVRETDTTARPALGFAVFALALFWLFFLAWPRSSDSARHDAISAEGAIAPRPIVNPKAVLPALPVPVPMRVRVPVPVPSAKRSNAKEQAEVRH